MLGLDLNPGAGFRPLTLVQCLDLNSGAAHAHSARLVLSRAVASRGAGCPVRKGCGGVSISPKCARRAFPFANPRRKHACTRVRAHPHARTDEVKNAIACHTLVGFAVGFAVPQYSRTTPARQFEPRQLVSIFRSTVAWIAFRI